MISVHIDDFINYVIGKFKNHYFCPHQKLVFGYHQGILLGSIFGSNGFVTENTKIKLITDDLYITIIDSSVMSRDLFREDFNFEEIGIGGLNDELANILRRALSSRAIKPRIIEKLGIKHVKGIILHGPSWNW